MCEQSAGSEQCFDGQRLGEFAGEAGGDPSFAQCSSKFKKIGWAAPTERRESVHLVFRNLELLPKCTQQRFDLGMIC